MDRNRLVNGRRGFGLELVMLAALAGTAFGQAPAPAAPGAAALPALPHLMGDETLTQAVQQNLLATKVANPRTPPVTPLHVRFDVKMVDYKGKEHTGTYEIWRDQNDERNDIHAEGYDWSMLATPGGLWVNEKGDRPLRMIEFAEVHALYRTAAVMATRGDQKLKERTVDGAKLLCGGQDATGTVCFDPTTGYVAVVIKDQEKVEYEDWRLIGSLTLASTVRKSFGKHVLFEAKVTEEAGKVAADAFAVPAGATPAPTGVRIDEQRGLVYAKEPHPQAPPTPGAMGMPPSAAGEAVVHVWVNEKGKVAKAEVEDADDKDSADAAHTRATSLAYVPYVENGKPAPFETTYFMRGMGGLGGMRGGPGGAGMGGDAGAAAPGGRGGGGMGGGGGIGGHPTDGAMPSATNPQ